MQISHPVEIDLSKVTRPELTSEQAEVIRRLEAYEHEYFVLRAWFTNSGGFVLDHAEPHCFRCVAGQSLGDGDYVDARNESRRLIRLCEESEEAKGLMTNLVMRCGRGVPEIRDFPADRVPTSVAIKAVRDIFLMANGQGEK